MTWLEEERREAARDQYAQPHPWDCRCRACARAEVNAAREGER